AYDSRRGSRDFATEAALVLCANGVSAKLFDALRPVPILSFALRHLDCAAGIVITASHNPPQYNGYKVYGEDGAQLGPEAAKGVMEEIQRISYKEALPMNEVLAMEKGLLEIIGNEQVDDVYMEKLKTLCIQPQMLEEKGKNLAIVYTPLHGSGNIPVRRILREVGITRVSVVPEQELPDPDFSTIEVPNPEDPKAFALAIALANQIGADVVFGTDPDCDRVGVGVRNKEGEFQLLTGNQIGCLLLHYILDERKKAGKLPINSAAIKSIVTTQMAQRICDDYGVTLFNTLTGFKFIGELIEKFEETKEYVFQFGFEESYGFLSSTFVRDKDGVNAAMLIAELAVACQQEGITLYDRLQELLKRYGYHEEHVVSKTLPGKDGVEKIQQIMTKLRTSPPTHFGEFGVTAVRDYQTGVRKERKSGEEIAMGLPESDVLYYELEKDAWCCIRPSGTEPKIKLYINTCASTAEEAARQNKGLKEAAEALFI
ncbi:MAG: phospho-sugar mutase, partial [Clostridiales bacterium]|nr:phospho-sugar mutase [Clostridiales bacterium]